MRSRRRDDATYSSRCDHDRARSGETRPGRASRCRSAGYRAAVSCFKHGTRAASGSTADRARPRGQSPHGSERQIAGSVLSRVMSATLVLCGSLTGDDSPGRLVYLAGAPRWGRGSGWRSCRRGRSPSCSPILRVQRACGRNIPKRCGTRWRATMRSCAARWSRTVGTWSRPLGMACMQCSPLRPRLQRQPSTVNSSCWPKYGRSQKRSGCGWVSTLVTRRFEMVTTTAPR